MSVKVNWFNNSQGYGFTLEDEGKETAQPLPAGPEETTSKLDAISDPGQKALAELVKSTKSFSHSVWSEISTSSERRINQG